MMRDFETEDPEGAARFLQRKNNLAEATKTLRAAALKRRL
jgi:hypothetical protein